MNDTDPIWQVQTTEYKPGSQYDNYWVKPEPTEPYTMPSIPKSIFTDEKKPAKKRKPKEPKPEAKPDISPEPKPAAGKLLRKVKELFEAKKTLLEIVKEIGKSELWVKGSLLIIQKLPTRVLEAIEARQLSRTAALQLLLVPADQLEQVIDGALELSAAEGTL